jgi:hypothetical protein
MARITDQGVSKWKKIAHTYLEGDELVIEIGGT